MSTSFTTTFARSPRGSQGLGLAKDTLYRYIECLEESYLIFPLPVAERSLRKRSANPKKLHAVDWALGYLARVWPRKHEIQDLRQETYARVYAAAKTALPVSPRSFLFTTAHHLMADRVRHERVVSIEAVGDIEALHVSVDEISVERHVGARQELRLLARALDLLPPKCRRVLWLRRVEGLSQREVAERLGVAEKTVEQHVSKGTRLLAGYVLGADMSEPVSRQAMTLAEDDDEHGTP